MTSLAPPPSPEPQSPEPTEGVAPNPPERGNLAAASPPVAHRELSALTTPLLALFAIVFFAWLLFAIAGYRERYAQAPDYFARGTTRTVELTLVAADETNLACASDLNVDGLSCEFRKNHQPFGAGKPDEALRLRPYNTVDNVLILGAGLWSSPRLKRPLPQRRFTVVCEFKMLQAVRTAQIRFSPKGNFSNLKHSVPTGTLSNCEIPL